MAWQVHHWSSPLITKLRHGVFCQYFSFGFDVTQETIPHLLLLLLVVVVSPRELRHELSDPDVDLVEVGLDHGVGGDAIEQVGCKKIGLLI